MSEYEYEPIPGLPGRLPPGEHILWQGLPQWPRLARDVFHANKVATYFAGLLGLRALIELSTGATLLQTAQTTAKAALWLIPLALCAVAILMLLAYLTQRTTIYTITNRRVVIRFGIALPMTINFPFRTIGAVSLRQRTDDVGDIPMSIVGGDRIAYLVLWPHARPWHVSKPEPMLRAVGDAAKVGSILANAIAMSTVEPSTVVANGAPAARKPIPSQQGEMPSSIALAS